MAADGLEEHFRELAGQRTPGGDSPRAPVPLTHFHNFQPWVLATIYMGTLAVVVLTPLF